MPITKHRMPRAIEMIIEMHRALRGCPTNVLMDSTPLTLGVSYCDGDIITARFDLLRATGLGYQLPIQLTCLLVLNLERLFCLE